MADIEQPHKEGPGRTGRTPPTMDHIRTIPRNHASIAGIAQEYSEVTVHAQTTGNRPKPAAPDEAWRRLFSQPRARLRLYYEDCPYTHYRIELNNGRPRSWYELRCP